MASSDFVTLISALDALTSEVTTLSGHLATLDTRNHTILKAATSMEGVLSSASIIAHSHTGASAAGGDEDGDGALQGHQTSSMAAPTTSTTTTTFSAPPTKRK